MRHLMRHLFFILLLAGQALALDNGVRLTNNYSAALTDWTFTIHRVFASGEITDYPRPYVDGTAATSWQADVHSRWSDGSVKSSNISFVATVADADDVYVDFRNSTDACHSGNRATCDAAALTEQQMLDFDTGGGTGSWGAKIRTTTDSVNTDSSARGMLTACVSIGTDLDNADCRYYLRGPVVTQVIVEDSSTRANDYGYSCTANCTSPYSTATWESHTTAGNTYKHLHPGYILKFIPSQSSVQVQYWLDSAWVGNYYEAADQYTGDQVYALTLYDGAAETNSIYTKAEFIHYWGTLWRKIFWQGTDLETWNDAGTQRLRVLTDWNFDYLIHTGTVPQFDTSLTIDRTDEVSHWDKWADTYENGDQGEIMGTGGFVTTSGNDTPNTNWIDYLEGAHLWWDAVHFLYAMSSTDQTTYERSYKVLWDYSLSGWGGNAAVFSYLSVHWREQDDRNYYCADSCTGANATAGAYGRAMSKEARPKLYASSPGNSANGTDRIKYLAYRTSNGISVDHLHWIEDAYISWLLRGEWWDRQELFYQAAFLSAYVNSSGGQATTPFGCRTSPSDSAAMGCGFNDSNFFGSGVRSRAWQFMIAARAAFASPTTDNTSTPVDSPEAEYWTGTLNKNIALSEGHLDITDGSFYARDTNGTAADPCPAAGFSETTSTLWCIGRVQLGYEHHTTPITNPLYILETNNATARSGYFTTTQWGITGRDPDTTRVNRTWSEYQTWYYLIALGTVEDLGFSQIAPLRKAVSSRLVGLAHAGEITSKPCALYAWIDSYYTPTHPVSATRLTVSSISNANPAVVTTSTDHGYSTSDVVTLCCGTGAWAGANSGSSAAHIITVTGTDTFTIPINATAFGSYTGQQFGAAKADGNSTNSPLQTIAQLIDAMAWYVSDPPAADAARCTWAKTTAGTSYQRVQSTESYPHQARAAATWLGDVSYGAYTGTRAIEILNNAIYFKDGYLDKPRYALKVRDAITGLRQPRYTDKILATAPQGTACTYLASQSDITSSLDSGDSAATQSGRGVEIDFSGWEAGDWNVRVTCGSARETITVSK